MSLFVFAPNCREYAVGEEFPKKPADAGDDEDEMEE